MSRYYYSRLFVLVVILLALWLMPGATRAWSQSSDFSSSNSSSDLQTWEMLSSQFQQSLEGQSIRLQQALTELETSKVYSGRLTFLLDESLQANESLKNYNVQIGQRMQERDEDLIWSYGRIDQLEEQRLRLIIAVVIMGALIVLLGFILFIIIRSK